MVWVIPLNTAQMSELYNHLKKVTRIQINGIYKREPDFVLTKEISSHSTNLKFNFTKNRRPNGDTR